MHNRAIILAVTSIAFVMGDGMTAMAATSSAPAGTSSMQPAKHGKEILLRRVKDPKQTLAAASVDDSSGDAVGHVQSIETFRNGHARAVMVSLTDGNKTVAIPARDLRYDKSSNTIDARLTKSQIQALSSHS